MELMSFYQITHEHLLNHIILPRYIPQIRSPAFLMEEWELLKQMTETVEEFAINIPANTLKMIRSLAKVHLNLTPNVIRDEINKLQPGETFAMFVRLQNSAIIIHMLPDVPSDLNNVIIATFPGNLHPTEVYNNQSDLEFNYPIQAIKIKYSNMLCSDTFAEQIYFLCENKLVDRHSMDYVSKWLITTLMDQHSSTAMEFPVIKKKIRDEFLSTKIKDEYIRRSSFYMVIKVLLQHNLTHELGEQSGKLLYKMIMLKFISNQINFYNHPTCTSFDIELAAQALAKLARRIEKLAEIHIDRQENDNEYNELKERIIDDARIVIHETRLKIDKEIENRQNDDEILSKLLPLIDLDFEKDIIHGIPKLRKYLNERLFTSIQNTNHIELFIKIYARHSMEEHEPPDIEKFHSLEEEIAQNLFTSDFENWILYELKTTETRFSSTELRSMFFAYILYAEFFYNGDQLGHSKIVLVSLKLISMLDSMVCRSHPLFLEHHTGINPKIINSLLLPHFIDMKIAYELETYFEQRNKTSKYPSLIGEYEVSKESFSARFAERDDEMQKVLKEIKLMATRKFSEKQLEWYRGRQKVQDLRNQISGIGHKYSVDKSGSQKHKKKTCTLCKLKTQIRNVKIFVYERPLPDDSHEQNAVVFELRIPIEVACLRDTLSRFGQCMNVHAVEPVYIVGKWVDYSQIQEFNKSDIFSYSYLGSRKSSKMTDPEIHVDENLSKFNVRHGFDCVYHSSNGEMVIEMTDDAIKSRCTMPVENKYKCLAWTLSGTSHTQNEVLARQSECPHELCLSEFKQFGSLRADGHRLQWRNLYAAIETESLSFENSSVFSLVMQSTWEAEISGTAGSIRESHEEFKCIKFSRAFIQLLNKFVERQKTNWAHTMKILMVTLITVRVFELNEDETLANEITTLLNRIRIVALDWIEKIQKAIQNEQNSDYRNQHNLREKLILAAISGALTFYVHSRHPYFEKIFLENQTNPFTAPRIWLQFIVTLNNNIILGNQETSVLNPKMLLRMVRNTGIHIESTLKKMIQYDFGDAHEFVKKHWTRSEYGHFEHSFFYLQALVLKVKVEEILNLVTIDLITGNFLVNNMPICRLPYFITQSDIFLRVFENFVFEVQIDPQNRFSSVQKYNDNSYEFSFTECGPIIIEIRSNGIEYELIPCDHLEGEISPLLIENYSHWWNKIDNKIEFRPKQFKDQNFSTDIGVEYTLDLVTRHLIHIKTRRNILDITSKSYLNIVKQISRLEQPRYINVLMDEPNIAKVELTRMRLKFKIDGSKQQDGAYEMLSNEFSRMRVSLEQKCGTLFGLINGLLLENVLNEDEFGVPSKKILLMPHGKINTMRLYTHVCVSIDLERELRMPPFHLYQVDEFCRQLKPNSSGYSAWFYLAYLHAVTSHGQIEPFLGMSGTERALQILQSGFVWSSAPYDQETVQILQDFVQLTPRRKLIKTMLNIKWPSFIHPHSAQDSYVFIVNKLLGDSERLKDLYPDKISTVNKEQDSKMHTDLNLNLRDYLRCLQLYPNLRISNEYIQHEELITSLPAPVFIYSTLHAQTLASLYHNNTYYVPSTLNLADFLIKHSDNQLPGPIYTEYVLNILNNIQEVRNHPNLFRALWISFYEIARKKMLNSEHFTLILTLLAHHKNEIDAIFALQTIAGNSQEFESIDPPNVETFYFYDRLYDEERILTILKNAQIKPNYYYNWPAADRREFDDIMDRYTLDLCASVTKAWPCDFVSLPTSDIRMSNANEEINALLTKWNNNRKLDIFIRQVTSKLHQFSSVPPNICPNIEEFVTPEPRNWSKYEIDLKSKLDQSLEEYKDVIETARSIWEKVPSVDAAVNSTQVSADDWFKCYEKISQPEISRHLIDAGMYPRNVPTMVLPMLISEETDSRLKMVIGAWALAIAKEHRLNRISIYSDQPQLKPALERELENEPYVNWKPNERPEWLLFEIEQNLTIRRIQIEIAKQMLNENPSEAVKSHFTMQLNMGEGKTAVIVPILASILANGQQICQITVLKSLFATNLKSLRQYLGGMLGRKIYLFPCRRDLPIDKCIIQIHNMYEQCMKNKGVILTLPEYRLSFQLKIYESVAKNDIVSAGNYLKTHMWLNENVRSILDESDAILDAKYQLIYTVGNQLPIYGGAHRWTVIQAILKRVPYHMKQLYSQYGQEKLEFNINYVKNGNVFGAPKVNYRADVFTPCRILDHSMFSLLKMALIEDFLNGQTDIAFPETTAQVKEDLRILFSAKAVDARIFEKTVAEFGAKEQNTVLILSGLLRFEVLKLILTKRWRVNYGVNEKSSNRKMAIPFKAKDVAEMTEFAHPDVALCFTLLSYYYSGLSDVQLLQAFELLTMSQNAADIYEKWIASIAPELIDPSIRTYSSINLIDPCQRNEILFPLFRFNMKIIDFWLSNVVFLHEAKSFEKKLMTTAWDLCSEHMQHRVTGFSGTNDTKNILPMSIVQNDLKELENTNEGVRITLLQPENQCYKMLPANVSAREILELLANSGIPVLLDAGALMLELNNKQAAKVWLKLTSEDTYDAALYFDSRDVLQAIDRNGLVAEFDSSVYRENLNRCLVYLDDTHTRGTDFKFPLDWKACVTLSGDITRDKTVQACMRMRQLGKGHTIAFWASFEGDIKIRETCGLTKQNDSISNYHVIDFICANSRRFETENTVHWAAAAHNYVEKLVAHKLYKRSTSSKSMQQLYEKCVYNEFLTLNEMYGDKEDVLLTDISTKKFQKLMNQYGNCKIYKKIVEFIQYFDDKVTEKLSKQAKNVRRFVHSLDDQQEKELEHEVEEAREVQRPQKSEPAKPRFDEDLILLIQNGISDDDILSLSRERNQFIRSLLRNKRSIIPLEEVLINTQLYKSHKNNDSPWDERLFVTKDFIQVLYCFNESCDEFLRPVWWIASIDDILILLSPYEVNRLLPHFRQSTKSTLYMFRPRLCKLHNDLLDETSLQITAKLNPSKIDVHASAQIKMFSGSMYFKNEDEQNAYCNFLGLIPRPRTREQENVFADGTIKSNGFVPIDKRLPPIRECVDHCKFIENPVDLALKLIEANHNFIRSESHAAAILERGIKLTINDENAV